MVPIESPWAVSYLTSYESNIVSLTIFEIFDIIVREHLQLNEVPWDFGGESKPPIWMSSVSYTHLTLPTIYSV